MREGVLFEITKEHLDTGLRGYPVGHCTTSAVDPKKGLTYVGIPIPELAFQEPLDVVYLLYTGKVGDAEEKREFRAEIGRRSECRKETLRAIEALPKAGHSMDHFAAALLLAGMYEGTDDYREDCLNVIAKLPQIAATVINSQAGFGPTPPPRPELGHIENFVHMLQLPQGKPKELGEVLRLFYILHLDHSGGNLSTFIGKAVASSLEPMYGSLAAAMAALAGPRHGRANQDSLEFVEEVLKEAGSEATPQEVEALLRKKLDKGGLLFGFGHAVLRVEDPRATICYQYCQKHFPEHPLVKMALLLRTEGSRILKENPKISDPHPNIDAITGPMLSAAGFPYPEFYTILFGLSRCVGIAIQIVYERLEARGGKGTPIVRPHYFYKSRDL